MVRPGSRNAVDSVINVPTIPPIPVNPTGGYWNEMLTAENPMKDSPAAGLKYQYRRGNLGGDTIYANPNYSKAQLEALANDVPITRGGTKKPVIMPWGSSQSRSDRRLFRMGGSVKKKC
jgi:hypothetical protein